MGYECPVCDAEEADGEHLANHLAFTALVRGGDHEAFLDEHVPDWESRDPESLAPEVTQHATETDAEPVTESHDHEMPTVERTGQADLSGEAAAILEEAQELTQEMEGSSPLAPEDEEGAGDDAADSGDDATGSDADSTDSDDDSETQ